MNWVQIKVLFIAGRIGVMNGAFHSLLSSVKELKKLGVVPIILLHTHGPVEDAFLENGIECRVLPYCGCTVPADRPSKLKGMIKVAVNGWLESSVERIIKEEEIDLVHINVSTSSIGAVSAIKNHIPIIWHLREFLEEDVNLTYINQKKIGKLLRSADGVIAISNAVAEHFRKTYDVNNIKTIYNGIALDQTLPVKKECKGDNMYFTLVGRIVRTKGQLEALKAFYKVVRSGYKGLKLMFVGDIGDQEYYHFICKYIRDIGLESYVEIYDHQNDLMPVWEKTSVALICSTREGFGRVTAEFMLNGVPVIGADTGGTPELLRNERGFIYQYGDEEDLAQKMMFVIENYSLATQMAHSAKEYAQKFFTAWNCAIQIRQVYDEILECEKK